MDYKAAIFDLDGTLVDSLMLLDVLWEKIGERFLDDKGFIPDSKDDKAIRTMPLTGIVNLIHLNYSIGESADELL